MVKYGKFSEQFCLPTNTGQIVKSNAPIRSSQ